MIDPANASSRAERLGVALDAGQEN